MTIFKKMMRPLIATATSVALVFAQVPEVQAQSISNQIDTMFGTLSSVTYPGVVANVERGGLYGGRLRIRARTMNTSIVNITPPSFRAGCGGLDFFGGSFSFISVEQFTQLLRNIASAALGYAFVIALKNVCEPCMTAISYLQRAIQMLNQLNANSCQLAQGLVNDTLTAMNFANVRGTSDVSLRQGVADAFEAFWSFRDDVTSLVSPTSMENEIQGNLGWLALQESNAIDWFASVGSGNQFLHAILTVTGTVIVSDLTPDGNFIVIGGTPEPAGQSNQLFIVEGYGTIKLDDILDGNDAAIVKRCFNETTTGGGTGRCDEGVAEDTVAIEGFLQRLDRLMEGDAVAGTPGILGKIMNDPSTLTVAERAFITSAGGWSQLGGMVFELAWMSPRNSTAVYELWAAARQTVALELAAGFFNEIYDAMDQAMSEDWTVDNPYFAQAREIIDRSQRKFNADVQRRAQATPSTMDVVAHFFQLRGYLATQAQLRLE